MIYLPTIHLVRHTTQFDSLLKLSEKINVLNVRLTPRRVQTKRCIEFTFMCRRSVIILLWRVVFVSSGSTRNVGFCKFFFQYLSMYLLSRRSPYNRHATIIIGYLIDERHRYYSRIQRLPFR